ncbi:MAG: NYN domain-containing protein [Planctomycetes bacterium]|nr:NYN domain-containing protein [Planctomycetota bacterium]
MKLSAFLKAKHDDRERVQIFIDASNLFKSVAEDCGGQRLDIGKFADLLSNKRKMVRIYYYVSTLDATLPGNKEKAAGQQRFINAIREIPYLTVTTSKLRYKKIEVDDTSKLVPFEKGVDIRIASDILTGALRNCYDTAILVSGDGDFAPVLEEIKRSGKQVENAAFPSSRSDALINASDLYIELSAHDLKDSLFTPKKHIIKSRTASTSSKSS